MTLANAQSYTNDFSSIFLLCTVVCCFFPSLFNFVNGITATMMMMMMQLKKKTTLKITCDVGGVHNSIENCTLKKHFVRKNSCFLWCTFPNIKIKSINKTTKEEKPFKCNLFAYSNRLIQNLKIRIPFSFRFVSFSPVFFSFSSTFILAMILSFE